MTKITDVVKAKKVSVVTPNGDHTIMTYRLYEQSLLSGNKL